MNSLVLSVAKRVCEGLGTPRSLAVKLLIEHGEWDQLSQLTCDPSHYLTASDYFGANVPSSFLKKYRALPLSVDNREADCVRTFYESEAACFRTNRRLSPYLSTGLTAQQDPGIMGIISMIRKEVWAILGAAPNLNSLEGRFGPGSTFADRGHLSTVPDKMTGSPTTTCWRFPVRYGFTQTAWFRALQESPTGAHMVTTQGNRFLTVPKDATKFRGICIEPSLNVFYQLAFGQLIRRKLRNFGIDLVHSQAKHRVLARQASRNGTLATLDLSNASDTLAESLVELLLPPSWYRHLDDLRSKKTFIQKKWVKLEKFSSMGNGFTFELETLVFLAICRVSTRLVSGPDRVQDVSVYGDDIIVPTSAYHLTVGMLRYFGFTPNPKKSFSEGPFRESCGGDFFNGCDVRPFFLKEEPNDVPSIVSLANSVQEIISKAEALGYDPQSLRRSWWSVVDALPSTIRKLRGPSALGDAVLHDPEVSNWFMKKSHDITYVKGIVISHHSSSYISWSHFRPGVVLASALLGVGSGQHGLLPRSAPSGYKLKWLAFP